MKKLVQTVTAFLLAFAMIAAPAADAQTRGRGGKSTSSGATAPNRPSNNDGSRPSHSVNRPGHSTSRPANPSSANHGNGMRPSGGTHSEPARPGNSGGNHFRPGSNNNGNHGNSYGDNHNRPGDNRPGNSSNQYRPGNNHGYGQQPPQQMRPQGHGHGPQVGHGSVRPPMPPRHDRHFQHHVPFFGTFNRPAPPPRWHYAGGGPTFGTILGVALGTAINASINALINHGYSVSSYGNDVVYLNNVPQMNYYWPDAALYYTNGVLTGSQFTYPSGFCDMSRYNSLYNTFTMQYGMPVQTVNNGGVISATWYGAGGRYVNLSFNSSYAGSYYTTLSFGN